MALLLVAAALQQGAQTVRSHRRTSAKLIRDYGAFAAWSYGQHISEVLRESFRSAVAVVVHDTPDGRASGGMHPDEWRAWHAEKHADADCASCAPSFFFRLPLAPGAAAEFAGQAPAAEDRAALAAAVREHAAGPGRPSGDFTAFARPAGRGLVVYALVGSDPGHSIVYGFDFDPVRWAPLFDSVFTTRQMLPDVVTASRANAELLAVEIRDPGGTRYLVAGDTIDWIEPATEILGTQLGGLRVRAGILGGAASSLTGGAVATARLPLMAALLALACALAVVAVYQMRRDAELARMRSDFVASVSHELRTPLAQVQLFLETLRLGRHRTDEQREWIFENMQRETTRLTTLVDSVLHFSRAERGVLGGPREPTALGEYLHGIIAGFRPLATVRAVTLTTSFEPGLVAQLHQDSFRQVILNLLDNAVKYGPKGQTVTVSTGVSGGRIHICIDDEGPGVEAAERARIFEPFRRGEKAIGSVAVGSGIGLTVARELVEWHDGTIRVENAPGGGARFVIELPGWRGLAAPADAEATAEGRVG